jgi:hypothetical protein
MPKRGITPKAVIEGPPRRKCAILLRQTSFKALEEAVAFKSAAGGTVASVHTARIRLGCEPWKGGAFPVGESPPGNRSSRKSEQS